MDPIRRARPDDVPAILQLVKDLAAYEREPDAVRLTEFGLHAALFGDEPAVFAHVAEADGVIQGFALWFRNFSTWEGVHGIYLEDLYVRPEARGRGYGKALLQTLARHAVAQGYARMEWSVLDWNAPSIEFYRGLGARPQEEWSVFRLTGEALAEVGAPAAVTTAAEAPVSR
ncbi:GNAT family N-acetyltransferase [Georgenia yuyongxinii]|uniref:GNAT family N-acetyltransferase n=1 Tax=Georgenia yuyongxinii TaxID=2589797 RepID=A0A552WPJ6_9MICO|nr:GNAT family N-acetyltransferase [Georgenia yuyongxinii]TRW44675.1 GNAT family N-acetyltransferase [Georgenia yuyongxinii]